MRLSEIEFNGQIPVDGYGEGVFRVAGELHEGPLILLPEGAHEWRGLADLTPLLALKDQVDVLFIGMGRQIMPLPRDIREELEAAQIPFDVMASPAACRTYNVLLGEGRRVGLAALPVLD